MVVAGEDGSQKELRENEDEYEVIGTVVPDVGQPQHKLSIPGGGAEPQRHEVPKSGGLPGRWMAQFWRKTGETLESNERVFKWGVALALYACLAAYLVGVFYTWGTYFKDDPIDWCDGEGLMLILFILIVWCVVYYNFLEPFVVKRGYHKPADRFLRSDQFQKYWRWFLLLVLAVLVIAFIVFIVMDTSSERRRLLSLVGWLFFILVGFVFSKHHEYIKWGTVIKGLCLQIIIALATIKWETGREIFLCLGEKVEGFLSFAYAGAAFVYGEELVTTLSIFAFQAMSVLYFVAMIVHILFYYGWLQVFCFKIGGWMQFVLGTTIIESVNAVTTIFLGMGEVTFVYKTYVQYLTKSEIHAVMTANFAAVAGSMLAAYTSLGAESSHLITSSCMAAPTALAFAKLFYPETKQTKTSSDTIVHYKSDDDSVMDAACKGAFSALAIIQGIIANLIACVSFVAFLNGILSWMGGLIGLPQLTFNYALGKVFIPVAWLMGVIPEQCEVVATLIGLKTTVNEFIAYKTMGEYKKLGLLSKRSEAIATFALCGFANPGSVSILLAVLSGFAPNQRNNIIKVAFRAFVSGSCTTFMSACIVGALMPESGF